MGGFLFHWYAHVQTLACHVLPHLHRLINRQYHGQDVTRSVYVAVMANAACLTRPLTHIQRERLQNMPTSTTRLRGRVPSLYLDEGASIPLGFVFQLSDEATPTHIRDGFS